MTRHLFLGGYADGEWREVDDDNPRWRVAEPPGEIIPDPSGSVAYGFAAGTVHVYIRRSLIEQDSGITHTFYVHPDVNPRRLFSLLVAGYRHAV